MSKIADGIAQKLKMAHLACHEEEFEDLKTQHRLEVKRMQHTAWKAKRDALLLDDEALKCKLVLQTQAKHLMHNDALLIDTKHKYANVSAEICNLRKEIGLKRDTLEKMSMQR